MISAILTLFPLFGLYLVGYHATNIIFQISKKNAVGYHATNLYLKI